MQRIIEQTSDGSATLYVPELNEHYHSVKGALTESEHIYIQMGLNASQVSCPHVLEIGFGTGLNALLTQKEAERTKRSVTYTGIELYPLEWETVRALHYSDDAVFQTIHQANWEQNTIISPHFTLRKTKADFNQVDYGQIPPADVVYFDAFAPEKQPEIWTEELFRKLYRQMNNDGILTTYCAKGSVRRMLQQTGFSVERLPGPPGGKREILRARK